MDQNQNNNTNQNFQMNSNMSNQNQGKIGNNAFNSSNPINNIPQNNTVNNKENVQNGVGGNNLNKDINIDDLLLKAATEGASDIHLSVGRPPTFRIDGQLFGLKNYPILSNKNILSVADKILNDKQKNELQSKLDVDLSYGIEDKVRFRVNVYHQMQKVSMAFRTINAKIPKISDLNLPRQLEKLIQNKQGFILFVGPTGHGKSTSMASLINMINQTRDEHIVTIEDPIEFIYKQERCIIDQREIGADVESFSRGLRAALREDIDVILVGEMRDPETIEAALTAAETGHLVFGTLHTNSAAQSIDRIIDSFPGNIQNQVRSQLANVLVGIISQRLLPKVGGGRIPAVEIMFNNTAVANMIRENSIHQINQIIETSGEQGMIGLNKSLANLVRQQLINQEQAFMYTTDQRNLRMLLR